MVLIYGRLRLRGTVALQASIDHCCRDRMAIAGRSPGGRPLRRRHDMVLMPATDGSDGAEPRADPNSRRAARRSAPYRGLRIARIYSKFLAQVTERQVFLNTS
jgi:hypothetical protein